MIDLLINIGIPLTLFLIGYIAGSIAEKNHYRSIRQREAATISLPVVTIRKVDDDQPVTKSMLVHGNVVVSIDYFKRVLAILRNIFGGRIRSYETLVDRGRREAILRMKEMAVGADAIINFRLETSSIGKNANNKNQIGSIEVFAYGTAVKYQK